MNLLFDALVAPLERRSRGVLQRSDGSEISGSELFHLSGQISYTLKNSGVVPDDRVAIQTEKSLEALALYLACLRVGALFVPLNMAYTASELEYFLTDAEPKMLICAPRREAELKKLCRSRKITLMTLGDTQDGSLIEVARQTFGVCAVVDRNANDLAAILYTSGTTGRSKGAMLSHENLLSNTDSLVNAWRFTSEDTLLHALPIFHAHGLFVAVHVLLRVQGRMIFLPKFDVDLVIDKLPYATTFMGVPTYYTRLLTHTKLNKEYLAHMRLFISGSAPLLAETHQAFEAKTGHRILERYGMTETIMNTSNPYEGERRAGTVGFALPNIELRIVSLETGESLPEHEIGQLEVRGPNVFQGYWRMPGKTSDEFCDDGFFMTGDIAKKDSDGYITIVGRSKDLVISGGYNVYPKEIESEINALDGILESAVFGVPHRDFGEAVIAVVVVQQDFQVDHRALIEQLQKRLAGYKCPKRMFTMDTLPRNTMGKVQKNVLKQRFKTTFTKQ